MLTQLHFVAPNATIRADEGTPFHIGSNTNIQDGVILHGLKEGRVIVDKKRFSIFYNAIVGEGSFISANAVITDGVLIPPRRFVPPGSLIDTQEKANALAPVPANKEEFAKEVQHVNLEFPAAYAVLYGSSRCSCGIAYDKVITDLRE